MTKTKLKKINVKLDGLKVLMLMLLFSLNYFHILTLEYISSVTGTGMLTHTRKPVGF